MFLFQILTANNISSADEADFMEGAGGRVLMWSQSNSLSQDPLISCQVPLLWVEGPSKHTTAAT